MQGFVKVCRYSMLSLLHMCSRRELPRTPEPSAVTSDIGDVGDYNRIMSTVMALPYALALSHIERARQETRGLSALDLCCGPGFFTLLLNRKLGFRDALGIDLSHNMIQTARTNAAAQGLDGQVRFLEGSAFDLSAFAPRSFDLVTFCNGAHQFERIEEVRRVINQADEVAKPEGMIFVLDPVRQKTRRLTEGYLQVAGQDYLDQGLSSFYRQFRESLYAAWTPEEFASAVPASTTRRWIHLLPNGLPTFQMLLGLPATQGRTYLRPGLSPLELADIVPRHATLDWRLLSGTFAAGSRTVLRLPPT
ncbi:MAG: hypothetical protein AMXMBFR66_14390 [Pseudomonadota bacterium]